jgi:DUF4097 and DUF4098 domain-containing protein YvlB
MKKTKIAAVAIWTIAAGLGQDTGDRINVPFSDASKPRMLDVETINGSITVRGYSGNEVIVEASGRGPRRVGRPSNVPDGMHQIGPGRSGLDITEENNLIKIRTGFMGGSSDLVIQVPAQTSLKLRTLSGGHLTVEGVSGEVDAQNMNGSVTITNVSGSVLANSMNGKVIVSLDRVTPNKNMSFSSMNGAIDVTLPADIKANVKMRSDNGEVWSDFDIKLGGGAPPVVTDDRRGKHIRVDRTMSGTINGGGPEMSFLTYNGSIVIRKK